MKKKYWLLLLITGLFMTNTYSQVFIGGRIGGGFGYGGGYRGGYGHRRSQPRKTYSTFKPEVYVSLGYGFPNVDAYQFSNDYYDGLYKGNVSQTGPFTGSIDYRYNRNNSIGIMATYGKVGVPYNDIYNSYQGTINMETWSVLLNFMQYAPLSNSATLYFREAIGANINNVSYVGSLSNYEPDAFAYQLGIGAKFKLTDNVSFFTEAGYGKYILHGGLSFAFK
jgi:Outer membrane protein beta-barrel domain